MEIHGCETQKKFLAPAIKVSKVTIVSLYKYKSGFTQFYLYKYKSRFTLWNFEQIQKRFLLNKLAGPTHSCNSICFTSVHADSVFPLLHYDNIQKWFTATLFGSNTKAVSRYCICILTKAVIITNNTFKRFYI